MNTRQRIILAVANGCPDIPALVKNIGVCRSVIHYHLTKAQEAGVVQWTPGTQRTLRLADDVQVLRLQNAAGETDGVYGIKHVYTNPNRRLQSITSIFCRCKKCRWYGTVGQCEPDVDGDGSLGCPKCFEVIKVVV